MTGLRPTRHDYDVAPERYRLGMRLAAQHTVGESLYDRIARGLAVEPDGPMLDVGTGDGPLRAALGGQRGPLIGLDLSPTLLAAQSGPVVVAHAAAPPFAVGAFSAVVAVNVLDHLAAPRAAIAEGYRVLRPAGLYVAATTSRHDSPELAPYWRPQPTPFDAEDAPRLIEGVFRSGRGRRLGRTARPAAQLGDNPRLPARPTGQPYGRRDRRHQPAHTADRDKARGCPLRPPPLHRPACGGRRPRILAWTPRTPGSEPCPHVAPRRSTR